MKRLDFLKSLVLLPLIPVVARLEPLVKSVPIETGVLWTDAGIVYLKKSFDGGTTWGPAIPLN
jgi:hypothetical protein